MPDQTRTPATQPTPTSPASPTPTPAPAGSAKLSPKAAPASVSPHRSSDEIRKIFIDFFKGKPGGAGGGHVFVPSSPAVPLDDRTLLFTNAGMNQFKPIFLGQADPKSDLGKLRRAVNTQKCIRAGGKHNDLDDVGKDTYHHTFFEMLGNWSFGDYFKAEAIAWSWELLTGVYGIAPDRLYATYFEGNPQTGLEPDEETRGLWLRYLPASHVLPGNMKDNFWEMGETGPCGPCTEIHYDRIGGRDAAARVNTGDPDVIEIWNNVFIQFNREPDGSLRPLPAKHVDTGMGFERLTSVLQHTRSNYDTDIFAPYFEAIERLTGARAYMGRVGATDEGNIDTAYRVIADHIRTLTIAITDGAVPSNEGRGYVLRRILRRAVRYGRQILGAKSGFFSQLVPVVVQRMGAAFPELKKNPQRVIDILREEEESFGRTLDNGIQLFELARIRAEQRRVGQLPPMPVVSPVGRDAPAVDVTRSHIAAVEATRQVLSHSIVISGEDAFKLYDTYGFPIDLTVLMAEERGIGVDIAGYERLMSEAKSRSRSGGKAGEAGAGKLVLDGDAVARLARMNIAPTDDSNKFNGREILATIRAIWNGENFDESIDSATDGLKRVGIILDQTSFYPEMGGQEADTGRIAVSRETRSNERDVGGGGEFRVEHVAGSGGYVLHVGMILNGELRVGDDVRVRIDRARRAPILAHHTATHMLNFALRKVLGPGVDQKGSLVAADRLRFDFSHNQPVSPDELARAEKIVREQIAQDLTVYTDLAPLYVAKGVRALRAVFGEAYPDPVRVVSIGQPIADLLDAPENPAWDEVSIEFCGGTHLASTKEAVAFAIISEEAVAKGVRRIVAVTGVPAQAAITAADNLSGRIKAAGALGGEALTAEVAEIAGEIDQLTLPVPRKHALRAELAMLQERIKEANKKASAAKAGEASGLARQIAESAAASLQEVIVTTIEAGSDRGALLAAMKTIQARCPRSAVMLFSPDREAGKVSIVAVVPASVVARGLNAGEWVRLAAEICGGKGGGKPDAAQGGGTDLSKIKEAISAASLAASRKLS